MVLGISSKLLAEKDSHGAYSWERLPLIIPLVFLELCDSWLNFSI